MPQYNPLLLLGTIISVLFLFGKYCPGHLQCDNAWEPLAAESKPVWQNVETMEVIDGMSPSYPTQLCVRLDQAGFSNISFRVIRMRTRIWQSSSPLQAAGQGTRRVSWYPCPVGPWAREPCMSHLTLSPTAGPLATGPHLYFFHPQEAVR